MSKAAMNLQDSFLNQVRRENAEVKVLLVNGTVLRGIVKGFDNFTLILNNRNGQHLVYKHAIAQLVSHRPQGARREGEEPGAGESMDGMNELQGDAHEAVAAAVSAPAAAAQPGADSRQKPRKEGFNTLDLSGVKIGSEGKK
jgi:host factor-I protein